MKWLPVFVNYRRDGYDFDSLWEDGKAGQRAKKIMDLFILEESELTFYEKQMDRCVLSVCEKQMEKAFNDTREELSRQVKAARTESAAREKALEKAEQEIEKLREQCLDARQSAETAQKKLGALQKEFDSKLAAGTAQFRTQVQDAQQALEKTQEELTVLQEQENNRSQAAARVRATMQELVQQYGRFGQSLEEASEQMRTLQ
jgi:chromosome segregation ATPase